MRDAWTIAGCMIQRLLHGWLLALLVVGLLTQLLFLLQLGTQPLPELLLQYRTFGMGVTYVSSALLVMVAAGTELPREVHTGTIFFILAKPVRRSHLVLGKLLGLLVLGGVAVLLQSTMGALVLAFRGLPPDAEFLRLGIFLMARVGIVAAAALFFSTLFSEMPTLMFTALYVFLGYTMALLDYFVRFAGLDLPLTLTLRSIYYLIPNMTYFANPVGGSAGNGALRQTLIGGYAIGYVVLLWCLSCWVISRREFGNKE